MTDPLSSMAVLSAGFVLGLRHALDADHVAAVSTMLRSSDNSLVTVRVGALWGAGHTAMLMLACLVVVPLKIPISAEVEAGLEGLVGVMLIFLGIRVLGVFGVQDGARSDRSGSAIRSILVGAMHGLAGSAALSVLILSTVDSIAVGMLYVVVFGVGSTLGMLLFSGLLSIPMRLIGRGAEYVAGLAGIAAGLLVLIDALSA